MSSPPPLPSSTPISAQRLRALLRQSLRITINDGRIFLGTFAGTDKQLNVLLLNAEEYRPSGDHAYVNVNGRFVGQVMIPWRLVVKVEAKEAYDPLAMGLENDGSDDGMYA